MELGRSDFPRSTASTPMMTTIDLKSGVASAYQERVFEIQVRKLKKVKRLSALVVHSTSFLTLGEISNDMGFTQPHLTYLVSRCNSSMEVRKSVGGVAFDSDSLGKHCSRGAKDIYHDNFTFSYLVFQYLKVWNFYT